MLFGLGLYGVSLSWMASFSAPGAIFVATLESAITAFAFALLPRRRAAATLPAGVVLADSLRSLWPFGGLPLGGLDLGQATGPLARSAAFGGRLLVIGLAAAAGTAIAFLLAPVGGRLITGSTTAAATTRRSAVAAVAAVSVVSALCWFAPTGTHNDGQVVRLAIIQGGGPRGQLASSGNAQRTFDAHVRQTERLRAGDYDVILWPENTVDVDKLESSREMARLTALAKRFEAPLVVGLVEDFDRDFLLNQQAVVDPNGTVTQRFEKVRRVPYGEYFPFRDTIEKYNLAPIPARDFRPGSTVGTLDAAGVRFSVSISYEGFFDDRSRGGVRAGGRALLIPTNASSYTTSQVPTQQVAAARLRAIETGRWAIQAGPTGLSVVATPAGDLRWRSGLGGPDTYVARIPLRTGFTPYVRFNDVPALGLTALGFLAGYVGHFRSRRRNVGS